MRKRTVSGNLVEASAPALSRWEARDEWGQRIVLTGDPDDPETLERWFAAPDAAAAAELAAELLYQRWLIEASTSIDVRQVTGGPWIRIEVRVALAVEVEISAGRAEVLQEARS